MPSCDGSVRTSEEIESIALAADGQRRFRATLTIDSSAIYKVHLVSKETGFENKFSPKYEVRPLPDLIPRVGFVNQQETTLLLPPNDIVALSALAEDDLPLVRLDQQFAVNGRDWQTAELPIESNRRVTTDWQWDLLSLNLKSGDQVLTRLVATDRKGNVGESVPLRIVVAAPEFDPNRHAAALLKSQFYDEVADFADRFAEHKTKAKELLDRLRDATRSADCGGGGSCQPARGRSQAIRGGGRTIGPDSARSSARCLLVQTPTNWISWAVLSADCSTNMRTRPLACSRPLGMTALVRMKRATRSESKRPTPVCSRSLTGVLKTPRDLPSCIGI